MSSAAPGSGGSYLLDASIILSLRGDAAIRARLAKATQLFIPCVALGELYFGAYGSPSRAGAALQDVATVATNNVVLGMDATTANVYARIKYDIKRRGLAMPDNDLWIAATAMQYDVTLVARDAHFNWITGLRVEQW